MFKILIVLIFIYSFGFSQEIPHEWLTKAERTNFIETARYEETLGFCKQLEKASPWIKIISIGKSGEGRDIPLLIVSKDKIFNPEKVYKSSKTVVLIQNGIHSGEIEGKDASLMLLRDIVITKKYPHLLDNTILLILPIYNVDGHERFGSYNRINQNGPSQMGWRTNATNLNLNRDYMKADALETRAFLKMFNTWLPDFFIDVHTTNGADYQYALSYSIDNSENM
ncbi:MAG: M14 family zinc carboxypeptidase, partial [Bacteroidota bacterium]|nr:M14 family zinc carboxypeptidase [Bacteroidota bacterium]